MDILPTDIRQAGPDTLAIDWSNGTRSLYDTRELRLRCPCATCHDEMTGERLLDPAQVPADVRPVRLESVGNYGIKISWTDGHDTGIYSFARLRELS